MYHEAICTNDRVLSDFNPFQDSCIKAQPHIVVDDHRFGNRCMERGLMPVKVGDHHIGTAEYMVANSYTFCGSNGCTAES